jgi:hypothetical protein
MVSAALKPHYRSQVVSRDEYTDINRRISRMLYERVGEAGLLDVEAKSKWNRVATEEVNKAVAALKELKANEGSESCGGAST